MALATRNLYLVLKARDEASRVIRGFGRELTRAGRLAQAENLRNRAGLLSLKAQQLQFAGASQREIDQAELLARHLRQQAQELERAHRAATRFANALHTVGATLITIGAGMVLAGGAGVAMLIASVNVAKEYARQVALTSTQVTGFKTNLQDLADIGLRVARSIAVPFEDIQPALYNIFSSTDANIKQSEILLTAFAKTAVAGQVSIQDAASGTIPILNAFNLPLESVNRILDIQFQLVRKGVGTYADFSAVLGRIVPSATRSGQSFETVAAMLAYLTRNGLTAAMASASAARALDAISNPVSVSHMEALGIKVRDVAGNFLPLETTLRNLQNYLLKLPNAKRVEALVDIFKGGGGNIQARRFLDQILLKPGELDQYVGFLNDMKNANGAFEDAYTTMSNTVAAQTQVLKNNWKVLEVTIGNAVTPAFVVLLKWVNAILQAFNGLSPSVQRFIAIAFAVVSVFTILAGVAVVVLGALASLVASIMTAGAVFFYMIGAVAAFVAVIGILAAALATAWLRSSQFRGMIMDVGKALKSFWQDEVLPAAQAVKDGWEKYMQPAFSRLADLLEHKVLPAARDLYQMYLSHLLPALKEVAMFAKTLVVAAFAALAFIITKAVIPAIAWLTDQYQKHKDVIDMIISKMIWLIKQVGKLGIIFGAVLAGSVMIAVIGSFLAFAAAIAIVIVAVVALVAGIIWLVKWIGTNVPKAWDWLAAHTVMVWNSIAAFFVGIWDWLTSVFNDALHRVLSYWNTFAGWFASAWNTYWNGPIGQLVIAVWNLIVSVVKFGVTSMEFVILWSLHIIETVWNAVWANVLLGLQTVWNIIGPYLIAVWTGIRTVALIIWNGLVAFFKMVWGAISVAAIGTWTAISSYFSTHWAQFTALVRATWNMFYSIISSQITAAWKTITGVWNTVMSFFAGAQSWLWDAGRNIIKGLINGVTSMINEVGDTIDRVTKIIRDHFPFSPAKIGPLSGRGSLFYAGQKMVKQLQEGINTQEASIATTAGGLAGSMAGTLTAAPGDVRSGGTTQIFNINTQEINPRRHSAELGFLLQAR